MNHDQKSENNLLMNKYLFYFMLWFFGLGLLLVILPSAFNTMATDWVSLGIILIGVIGPIAYMSVLTIKKKVEVFVLFAIVVFDIVTLIVAIVDFGEGWGAHAMLVGCIIQSVGFVGALVYGLLTLLKRKDYVYFAQLLIIIIINFGFVIDAAIIFYPEAYQSLPIYSLISYVLSWVLIHLSYRMTQINLIKDEHAE